MHIYPHGKFFGKILKKHYRKFLQDKNLCLPLHRKRKNVLYNLFTSLFSMYPLLYMLPDMQHV